MIDQLQKKMIIKIINGDFLEKYHDDEQINKFLKKIEKEASLVSEYFYKIDNRIDDENIYNYKFKNLSRILQDIKNQLLMNLYDYFTFNKIKMTSLIFDGIICLPRQRIDKNDIQNYIFKKSGIPMKICIKALKEFHPRFGESNVSLKRYNEIYKCKTYINQKVIHHYHYKKTDNIAGYICNNSN